MPITQIIAAALLATAQDTPKPDEGLRSESLKQVRNAVEQWSSQSWDEVLADDVRLGLRMTQRTSREDGTTIMTSTRTDVIGKEKVKQALTKLHQEYGGRVTITSEFLSGQRAVLIGEVAPAGEGKGQDRPPSAEDGVPVVILMNFDQERKIEQLTITSFSLQASGAESK
jgi:hypothetical protein